MRGVPLVAAAVCGVTAVVLLTASTQPRDDDDARFRRGEVARLRAHFDSVLAELGARDVSDLRASQRAARAVLVRRLERYRDAGVFPHNHAFPGLRVPYFRDGHGTLCAMAYLVASTGGADLVEDIARGQNNALIPELAADRRLVAWLDSVGLTAAEAARIQPAYNGGPGVILAETRERRVYVLPSLALAVPAAVATVLNWRAPRAKRADAPLVIGALTGAGAAILGAAILAEERDGSVRAVGVADLAVGTAALVSVVRRNLRRTPSAVPPPVASDASRLSLDLTPATHGGALGLATRLRLRF